MHRGRIAIRDRLRRSFMSIALIPTSIFFLAFALYTAVNTWNQSTALLTGRMSRIQLDLEQLMEEASQVARTVANDRDILEELTQTFADTRGRYRSELSVNNELGYISRYFDSRLEVYIIAENGAQYKNGSLEFLQEDFRHTDWYENIRNSTGEIWFPMRQGSRAVNTLGGSFAALGVPLRLEPGGEYIGALLVEARVDEVISDLLTGEGSWYIIAPDMEMRIVDERVRIYEENNITVAEAGDFRVLKERETPPDYVQRTIGTIGYWRSDFKHFDVVRAGYYKVCYAAVDANHWIIVNCVPYLRLYRAPVIAIALLLFGIAVLFFLVIRSANRVSTTFTAPIVALNETAHRVGDGDFDLSIEKSRDDELGDLSDEFNRMIRHVKRLMQQVVEEQEIQRSYELLLLQAQINPHFLYNTLDSIVWLVRMQKNDDAITMLEALIDFFRSGLSKGSDVVPLSQEIMNVRSYMTIQEYRYRTKLTWDAACDDDIAGFQVPRLTLQPLVENAIYHGIKEKEGPGHISVACWPEEGAVMLQVTDDGLGMSREALEALRAQIDAQDVRERKSYGVINVFERLRLFFKDRCVLSVESTEHEGTCVTIEITMEAEDNV